MPLGQLEIQPPDEPPSEIFALSTTSASQGTSSLVALMSAALTSEPLSPVQDASAGLGTDDIETGIAGLWKGSSITPFQQKTPALTRSRGLVQRRKNAPPSAVDIADDTAPSHAADPKPPSTMSLAQVPPPPGYHCHTAGGCFFFGFECAGYPVSASAPRHYGSGKGPARAHPRTRSRLSQTPDTRQEAPCIEDCTTAVGIPACSVLGFTKHRRCGTFQFGCGCCRRSTIFCPRFVRLPQENLARYTRKPLRISSIQTVFCGLHLLDLRRCCALPSRFHIAGVLALVHVTHGHSGVAKTVELLRPRHFCPIGLLVMEATMFCLPVAAGRNAHIANTGLS